jgi:hypothetical protein
MGCATLQQLELVEVQELGSRVSAGHANHSQLTTDWNGVDTTVLHATAPNNKPHASEIQREREAKIELMRGRT